MKVVETLTWMFVAGVVLTYARRAKVREVKNTLLPPPSAQREVDPTRWRHDGTQPAMGGWGGNRIDVPDQEVLALQKALAF